MTTLVVEDGTGLINSNSYITVAEADTYLLTDKYRADWENYDDEDKGNVLIKATELLDAYFEWFGSKTEEDSALRWPRTGVFTTDGVKIADNEIPINLKRATAEMAFQQYTIDRQAERTDYGIKELKVDVIELKFDKSEQKPVFPDYILALLRGLGYPVQGIRFAKVGRS